MSNSPSTPKKQKSQDKRNKVSDHQQAKLFISWYKQMIDNERHNLGLYISDDAVLEWFGRTIKTRKKVSAFLKYDMQCSQHDFVSIQCKDKIQNQEERFLRKKDNPVTGLPNSPEVLRSRRYGKQKKLRSNCSSPEWAEGCQPVNEPNEIKSKKPKLIDLKPVNLNTGDRQRGQSNGVKRKLSIEETDVNSKGDGVLDRRVKHKVMLVTPPNCEVGQGDCMPSTSTGDERPIETFNTPLSKLFVECNGYIEFTRTRNSRSTDTMKWERKCKVQICYSEDPLNVGEYIIWAIHYTDENKCRRNLLPAFEEVAAEMEKKVLADS